MSSPPDDGSGAFESGARTYAEDVERSVAFTGKGLEYFTWRKAERLVDLIERHLGPASRQRVLDVGCGVGTTDGLLAGRFGALIGVDPAHAAIAEAARANPGVEYSVQTDELLPLDSASVDVAFTINVMHHVPPEDRAVFVSELRRVVRPGGLAIVFEHNPMNPLTRLSVMRCEFDADAVLVRRGPLKQMLASADMVPIDDGYIIFTTSRSSRVLSWEARLRWLPAGAQYYAVARRPAGDG